MPSRFVWRAATSIAMASSCPGSQSRMIEGAGDISAELATVTLLVVGSITLNARIASGGMAVVLLLTACSDDTSGSAATEQTGVESVEVGESSRADRHRWQHHRRATSLCRPRAHRSARPLRR
jgi:hypothetical protein